MFVKITKTTHQMDVASPFNLLRSISNFYVLIESKYVHMYVIYFVSLASRNLFHSDAKLWYRYDIQVIPNFSLATSSYNDIATVQKLQKRSLIRKYARLNKTSNSTSNFDRFSIPFLYFWWHKTHLLFCRWHSEFGINSVDMYTIWV